jgi:hypothetical protein
VKEWIFYGVIMLVLLGFGGWLLSYSKGLDAECTQKGGIRVKTFTSGYACIDRSAIK